VSHYKYIAALLGLILLGAGGIVVYDTLGLVRNCSAKGYSDDQFLGGCTSDFFGNYERAAYLFNLEPDAVMNLRDSAVVFLGTSRPMLAFGTHAIHEIFESNRIKYYLFGFPGEGEKFPKLVMQKLGISPQVLVINVDVLFFDGHISIDAPVGNTKNASTSNRLKKMQQIVHHQICSSEMWTRVFGGCPDKNSIFRSRSTGKWDNSSFHFADHRSDSFKFDYEIDAKLLEKQMRYGREFLEGITTPRNCIVLTTVPYTADTPIPNVPGHLGTTQKLAEYLGVRSVLPRIDGLLSFDGGSHLDAISAERYSRAFAQELMPIIKECVAGTNMKIPVL
jgi:hypothetical protein